MTTNKIKLIKDILTQAASGFQETIKEEEKWRKQTMETPDDEMSNEGNPEWGRQNKESVMEGLTHQIAYRSAVLDMNEKFFGLLDMSEESLRKYIEDAEQAKIESAKERQMWKEEWLGKAENRPESEQNPHISWCKIHGTNRPWGTDPGCTCPGAYVLRKRMKEGMPFEEAKQWVGEREGWL